METDDRSVGGDDTVAVGIGVTDLALSKENRFLDETWLKYEIARFVQRYPECPGQELYSKGEFTAEFHLVFPGEEYAIVLADRIDYLTVITQMHDHPSYTSNPIYHYVSDERWHKRFNKREPARRDHGEHRERLDVDIDSRKRIMPATTSLENLPAHVQKKG